MGFRKFSSDRVFTGHEMLTDGAVIIAGDNGQIEAVTTLTEAGDDVRIVEGIISPGFINCHCHLELSHMKGAIPEHTGIVPFLLTVMGSRIADPSRIAAAIDDAENDMIRSGIVAVADICNTHDTITQKSKRRLYYHNFVEVTGFVAKTAKLRFSSATALAGKFDSARLSVTLSPHAPYSVSETLFRLIDGWKAASLITMHNQESDAENEFFKTGTGNMRELYTSLGIDISDFRPSHRSSLQTVLPYLSAQHRALLVHDVVTATEDLDWLEKNAERLPEIFWCLCPNANNYISGKLPDIEMLRKYTGRIVIGTDSLASNHRLDIVSELAAIQSSFPAIRLEELLRWATVNGAEALFIDSVFGDFSKGKRPGMVLIEGVGEDGSLRNARSRML